MSHRKTNLAIANTTKNTRTKFELITQTKRGGTKTKKRLLSACSNRDDSLFSTGKRSNFTVQSKKYNICDARNNMTHSRWAHVWVRRCHRSVQRTLFAHMKALSTQSTHIYIYTKQSATERNWVSARLWRKFYWELLVHI